MSKIKPLCDDLQINGIYQDPADREVFLIIGEPRSFKSGYAHILILVPSDDLRTAMVRGKVGTTGVFPLNRKVRRIS